MTEQDPPSPAETAIAALRDLTEAVAEVVGRMFDLPSEDAA